MKEEEDASAVNVDGFWSAWSSWSSCTRTCGAGGFQTRSRVCTAPQGNGVQRCLERGHASEIQECSTGGPCTTGTYVPFLTGSNPNTPNLIVPPSTDTGIGGDAALLPADTEGVWAAWSDWGSCTLTCGSGFQIRSRICGAPTGNGRHVCLDEGHGSEVQACLQGPCPSTTSILASFLC